MASIPLNWVNTALYRRSEFGLYGGGGVAALSVDQMISPPAGVTGAQAKFDAAFESLRGADIAPDLGSDIGSLRWWRGIATCTLLCTGAVILMPDFQAFRAPAPPVVSGDAWEETRAQTIAPLAWGSDTGKRMAANDLVAPLGDTPERPSLSLTATLGQGDGFTRVLERAGVGGAEARAVAAAVANAVPLSDIEPGISLT